jgi:hypothetical protein
MTELNKKITIVMDATMLDTLQACPFKFHLRHNLNRVPFSKAEALDRGDLMHYAKEPYYLALKKGLSWPDALAAGIIGLRVRAAEESELSSQEIDVLVAAFQENVTLWKAMDVSLRVEAVETPFSFVLYEDDNFRFVMAGKIDLLFSNERYTNCPMDTKTYSRAFPLRRSTNQFCCYATATQSNYLFVDRVGLQSSLKPQDKHKRVPLSYDKAILDEWKEDTIKWFMYYYDFHTDGSWPKNRTSCDKYNRLCEYHDSICDTSGKEAKLFKLENEFKVQSPWDVTAPHGKERAKKNEP